MAGMQSEAGLFEASVESANIFNSAAAECASTGGLLDALRQASSLADVRTRLGFHVAKDDALRAFLSVLADTGLVEQQNHDSTPIYRVRPKIVAAQRGMDGSLVRHTPNREVLNPWFGDSHVDLIRSSNCELLGDDLRFFRSSTAKIRFDRQFFGAWRTNLSNPLYEFGRLTAVREMVRYGNRFLDLACGMGYGAQRLAEYSEKGCQIIGIDRSEDMLSEARRIIYPGAKISFIQRDLNTGLPQFAPESFDGVLFNGAFHFIKDKHACLREIYRALRPGGILVIGHCFCRSGFQDEAMHDLYFSMLENPIWTTSFEDLRSLTTDEGFIQLRQYHRGSHSYLISVRDDLKWGT